MYPISQNFKDNIYAPIRSVKGRVVLNISDVTVDQDTISTSTSPEFELSNKEQLTDNIRENEYNYATLEKNRFKLDGSFSFADDVLVNNDHVGWCSQSLCGDDGIFVENETLTFEFGMDHTSMGITVTFDRLNDEYAADLIINAYDSNSLLIVSKEITNNSDVQIAVTDQFYNYRKIDVIIKKWSKPHRRARVSEVDFGVIKVYDENSLIKMNLIEEMDLITSVVPSPEFKFVVDNSDRSFNILNPEGYYQALQQRQEISVEMGVHITPVKVEYVPLGQYLLWEWVSDEGSLTTTFTGRTNLDVLSTFDYENLTAKTDYSLYQMAVDIFNYCEVDNYSVDDELKNISTSGLVRRTNCNEVLKLIAIAGCANIHVTRDNKITMKVSPLTVGSSSDVIDMDNSFYEPKIELEPLVKSVSVKYYTNIDTSNSIIVLGSSKGDALQLDNTLINTAEQATNVADWILRQKNNRNIYTLNWRGNPALELNDLISIENSYGANKSAYITKNELSYEGYLSVKTEARGVSE